MEYLLLKHLVNTILNIWSLTTFMLAFFQQVEGEKWAAENAKIDAARHTNPPDQQQLVAAFGRVTQRLKMCSDVEHGFLQYAMKQCAD